MRHHLSNGMLKQCWMTAASVRRFRSPRSSSQTTARYPRNGEGKSMKESQQSPTSSVRSCLPRPSLRRRAAASRCRMARRGIERGSLRSHSNPVSRSYRAGASSRPRRKRHQDIECRQNGSSHEASQNKNHVPSWEWTRHEKCWRASRCDSENVHTFKQVKSHSAMDARARKPALHDHHHRCPKLAVSQLVNDLQTRKERQVVFRFSQPAVELFHSLGKLKSRSVSLKMWIRGHYTWHCLFRMLRLAGSWFRYFLNQTCKRFGC